jgi:hypothetical protein
MREIRKNYADIFARCQETLGCFIHAADPRSVFEVTDEEREAFWEKRYGEPGFGIWMGNFRDVLIDREANKLMSDYLARKIRQRVKDPAVAEKLVPKTHGFGTRRVPLESGYFEVYNQLNVKLVDLTETPIERITPESIRTSSADYQFDMIIYATGFDAITGAFDQIDIRGVGGVSLKDKWADGTLLGILVDGFPNLMMVMGPHAGLGNFPRAVEYTSDWVTALIRHAHDNGMTRVDATPEAAKAWTHHVIETNEGLLFTEVDSWMTGINRNLGGQTGPPGYALQRWPSGVPRTLRGGFSGGLSGTVDSVAVRPAAAPATFSGPRPERRTSQGVGTPMDLSRACARLAWAFRPSR